MSEELILRHCAPTLAGMKTGNLFSCAYDTKEALLASIRRLNQRLRGKGIRILPLRCGEGRALIYLYRPSQLQRDFSNQEVAALLSSFGYRLDQPEHCVAQLATRLRKGAEFPHEIGLFLGYPPEDVSGFVRYGGGNYRLSGCWKVYGDIEAAQKRFSQFKKCTEVYQTQWKKGTSIERLTVAV